MKESEIIGENHIVWKILDKRKDFIGLGCTNPVLLVNKKTLDDIRGLSFTLCRKGKVDMLFGMEVFCVPYIKKAVLVGEIE